MRIDTIKVGIENGSMTINIDNFFPCNRSQFNKLFKIIRRSSWLNDGRSIAGQLEQNFTDRIQENEALKAGYAKRYFNNMQVHADYERMVGSGKHPNGNPLTKKELKHLKEKAADAMRWAKQYLAETKKIEREIAALKKNLDMLVGLEM